MKIANAQEMRLLDQLTIQEYGIPGLVLMENAGAQVFREMLNRYGSLRGKKITVVAGKGNNGGDGFVVGRHLLQNGLDVRVVLLSEKNRVQGDAKSNLAIYQKIGGEIHVFPPSTASKAGLEALRRALAESDLVVDAIFGTGLTKGPEGPSGQFYRRVIDLINECGKAVIAVDIPSGISSDTGEILQSAVRADLTVTFGLPKRGHFLFPGAAHRGALRIVDIGIPRRLVNATPIPVQLLTGNAAREALPPRPIDGHKGSFGHALIIAGSVGKTGAAAMTALSALRTGAGLATLATPASLNPILEQKLTEVMTVPLPETSLQSPALAAEKALLDLVSDKSVVVLGPGLSSHPETQELVRKLLESVRLPVVIDADGLNALVGHIECLKRSQAQLILTPHPGEMARLLGTTSAKVQSDRLGTARAFSQQHRVWLILKGAHTVLAEPEGNLSINPTGNPGMATGGTGDVLAGVLGGLISQGSSPREACQAGIYLHGLAGDIAASEVGTMGLIAGDLIDRIPRAMQKIRDGGAPTDPYDPLGR